ncbi:ATP-binding protein [Streptomyces sp. DSM 118878]
MKQSAAKTLGVAALGAAFAVAGAGAASAAPAAPDVPGAAVLESATAAPGALVGGLRATQPIAEETVRSLTSTDRKRALGAVLHGLPVNGSGLNGVPL